MGDVLNPPPLASFLRWEKAGTIDKARLAVGSGGSKQERPLFRVAMGTLV